MPHRPKAKIIQFPIRPTASKDKPPSPLADLKELFATSNEESKEPPKARKPRVPKPKQDNFIPGVSILVSGGNGVVINNGNKTVHNYHTAAAPVKPTVIVQTGVGVISAEQKRQLLDLRDKVVEASVAKNEPKTPGGVMLALNKYMKVNKYVEILAVDFEKARKRLLRDAAIAKSMASAPKKMDNWRNSRISAIHSRCKERNYGEWRIAHMKQKFNVTTMVDLSDQDLETLYRTVMGKK